MQHKLPSLPIKKYKKIIILGAGPTGLALTKGLNDINFKNYVLIEKDKDIGGLAKTIKWKNYGYHDLGPHKIFSSNESLLKKVKNILNKNDWNVRIKKSSIFLNKTYMKYPPGILDLTKAFGFQNLIFMTKDFLISKLNFRNKEKSNTFETDIINRMGIKMYLLLFKPIAAKIWGDPKKLDAKLSKSRVQTPGLIEYILKNLNFKSQNEFDASKFIYPKGGLQNIWKEIIKNNLLKLENNTQIDKFIIKKNRISSIILKKNKVQKKLKIKENELVVSTLPIGFSIKSFKNLINKKDYLDAVKTIKLNDLILVFIFIENKELTKDSWIFVPDKDVIFHRVSEQNSFDKKMVKKGSILCCEIMKKDTSPENYNNKKFLFEKCIEGLKLMGFRNLRIIDKKIIFLPKSYPVYLNGYEKKLSRIIKKLDKIKNFKTIGRQGSFNYIGTLDAMDIGFGFSRWIENGDSWNKERERTKYYPILD